MTLEERVKALEIKLCGSGWNIEGVGASKNFSPNPTSLLSKRVDDLEKKLEELKEQIVVLADSTDHSLMQIESLIAGNSRANA